MDLYRRLRPLLFRLDAERAHGLGKRTLAALGAVPPLARRLERASLPDDPRLAQELWGRRFPSPVGLAAGFDKDGEAVAALPALGFGFAEIGTVTPRPQPGNPRPRLFRLPGAAGLHNRLGFNNAGAAALAARLRALPPALRARLPLAVNLGKNKDTPPERALDDYRRLLAVFAPLADFLVVNVSSPNTPGLRDLQSESFLAAVLAAAREVGAPPVLVKLDPDTELPRLVALAAAAVEAGAAGIVATNTTVDHSLAAGVRGPGGLSGAVLRERSFAVLRALGGELGGRAVLVSVGGVDSAEEVYRRLRAGARLVELYTALVYRGPRLLGEIHRGLLALLERDGLGSVAEAVGADLPAS
ncbi:MAG TPA: quinone-dependent dihydroorotate dehydrogenase [Thermoanaerobaculia bacterium]|nr:quinone-dependent dihydroorotate dehydrogenase [Thermoanaerobaculia bacterium]